jgi:cytochrome c-type biogenesis protein CcmE
MVESSKAWQSTTTKRPAKRRSNTKFIIGGVVFALAVAYMIYSAVQASSVYYLTIRELLDGAAGNGPARVAGQVVKDSVQYDAKTMNAQFMIADGPETLKVAYKGVLPDAFQPEVDVIIEGRYTPGQPFQAKEILTKCPSKYENAVEEPAAKQ